MPDFTESSPKRDQVNTTLKIQSINIQGINSPSRQEALIDHLLTESPDIFLINETWAQNPDVLPNLITYDKSVSNIYNTLTDSTLQEHCKDGQGTAILIKRHLHHDKKIIQTIPGCFTGILLKLNGQHIFIASVYISQSAKSGTEHDKLIVRIDNILNNLPANTKIILGGDWNTTIDPQNDRFPSRTRTAEPHKLLKGLINNHALIDIWRLQHPDQIEYTHRVNSTSGLTKSRIDMFLISDNLINHAQNASIKQQTIDPALHHDLIEITLITKHTSPITLTKQKALIIHRSSITDEHIKNFNQLLATKLTGRQRYNNRQNTQEYLNQLHQQLQTAIISSAKETLPNKAKNSIKRNVRRGRTWKKLTIIARANQSQASEHYIKATYMRLTKDENPVTDMTTELMLEQCIRILRNKAKQKRNTRIRKHMKEIRTNFIHSQRRCINNTFDNNIQWPGTGLDHIIDKDTGECTTEPLAIKTKAKTFFEKIMTDPNQNPNTIIPNDWTQYYSEPRQTTIDITQPITKTEMTDYIKSMPNNKAPGPSEISNDLLKLITDESAIDILLEILNISITNQIVPTNDQLAKIILLPKIRHWDGQLEKTRPITLLESTLKLYTGIITKRLTSKIDEKDLLKGNNFGFRTGRSTTDALLLLRACVDDAKIQKIPLYAANLDITKAFDSVPYRAIIKGLQRLGTTAETTRLITSLLTNRIVTIVTPYGETDQFTPSRGVPQGDTISPILWNIFYEPLLLRLQQETAGYTMKQGTKIAVTGFADDITPLASTPQILQKQLDIISEFMQMWDMQMSPEKSSIITNLNNTDLQRLTHKFMLSDKEITDVRDGKQITRFLGVHWTFDGNTTQTLKHTMAKIKAAAKQLNAKYTPGPIATYLTNTVIIPRIAYQLQLIPLTKPQLNNFEQLLRGIIKRKHKLPMDTPRNILHDPRLNINLTPLGRVLSQKMITDFTIFMSKPSIQKEVTADLATTITIKENLPVNILLRPTPLTKPKRPTNIIAALNETLREHNWNISDKQTRDKTLITSMLTQQQYDELARKLHRFQVDKWEKLIETTSNRSRTRTNNKKLMSYHDWASTQNSQTKTAELMILTDNFPVPEFYQQIIKTVCVYDTHTIEDPNYKHTIKPDLLEVQQDEANMLIEAGNDNQIDIWTDGSLRDGKMGAAAIFNIQTDTTFKTVGTERYKPTDTNPSSTKAELHGIFAALTRVPSTAIVNIYTDSKAAIAAIQGFQKAHTTRLKLKYTNNEILEAILRRTHTFTYPPSYYWIKGHSTYEYNNMADHEANEAAKSLDTTSPQITLTNYTTLRAVEQPIGIYPGTAIKNQSHNTHKTRTNDNIRNLWGPLSNDAINRTCRITRMLPKQNRLDATYTTEHKFRLQTVYQTLPTLARLHTQDIYQQQPTCQRCESETEDYDHIWHCETTIEQLPTLYSETRKLFMDKHKKQRNLTHIFHVITNCLKWNDNTAFLSLPESKGVVTDETLRKMNQHHPRELKWLNEVLNIWMQTFYSNIWKTRCQLAWENSHPQHQPRAQTPTNSSPPPTTQTPQIKPPSPIRTPPNAPEKTTNFICLKPPNSTPSKRRKNRHYITPSSQTITKTPQPITPNQHMNRKRKRTNSTTTSPNSPTALFKKPQRKPPDKTFGLSSGPNG
jgi:exonuclease III/ribonuclease HI